MGTRTKLIGLVLGISLIAGTNADCQKTPRNFMPDNTFYMVPSGCDVGTTKIKDGCTITLQCNDQYYVEDDALGRSGLPVKCVGSALVLPDGKPFSRSRAKFDCQEGCLRLSDSDMRNATYRGGFPKVPAGAKTYYNGNNVVYPKGTTVQTTCKNNFQFTNLRNLSHPDGIYDHFVCTGGSGDLEHPWKDQDGYLKKAGAMPGMCDPLCNKIKLSDLPPNVKIQSQELRASDPSTGEERAIQDATAVLVCEPGFKYDDKSPSQNMICKGGNMGWVDSANPSAAGQIKPCIKSGCAKIGQSNVDPNTIVNSNCSGSITFPIGCQVNLKCKEKNHFYNDPLSPNDINQKFPNGINLKCSDNGWTDQTGTPVTMPGGIVDKKCDHGCPVETTAQSETVSVAKDSLGAGPIRSNGKDMIYQHNAVIRTTCKPGFSRPENLGKPGSDSTKFYQCSNNGWQPADGSSGTGGDDGENPYNCLPTCEALPAAGSGTTYENAAGGVNPQGQKVTVKCQDGYELPASTYPNGVQTLECKGGPQGWVDPATGSQNAKPATCVVAGAKGCDEINDVNNEKRPTDANDCVKENGLYPIGCEFTIKCKDGYVPKGGSTDKPTQTLVCKALKEGWYDTDAKKVNATPLACESVCQLPKESTKKATVEKPAANMLVDYNGKSYAKNTAGMSITCSEGYIPSFTGTTTNPKQVQTYVCEADIMKWRRTDVPNMTPITTPSEGCIGVCDVIEESQLTNAKFTKEAHSTTIDASIFLSKVYESKEYGSYEIVCNDGHVFPDGSQASKDGKQTLVCVGGPDGYIDPSTNKTKATPTPCERGSQPGCALPPNSKLVPSDPANCKFENNKYSVGCKGKLLCADGSFDPNTGKDNTQDVECKDNSIESKWKTPSGADAPSPNCVKGCTGATLDPNAEYVSQSDKKNFYNAQETVKIRCKAGSLPLGSDLSKDPQVEMEYQCLGPSNGNNEAPWQNKHLQTRTKVIGGSCITPCKFISTTPKSLRRRTTPPRAMVTAWGTDPFVLVEDLVIYNCQDGYEYPEGSAPAKGKRQDLSCNLETGKWNDVTDNRKEVDGPTECISSGTGCNALENVHANGVQDCPTAVHNSDGCKLTVKCDKSEGATMFVPEEGNPDGLELTCKNNRDWTTNDGKVYTGTGLKCKPVCNATSVNKNSKLDTTSLTTIKGTPIVLPNGVVDVKCEGDGVIWEIDVNKTTDEHMYTCTADGKIQRVSDKTIVPQFGDGCAKTCAPLDTSSSATLVATPPQVHDVEGKKRVKNGDSYQFKCKNNYEYAPDSPLASRQSQVLKCDGDSGKYKDPTTGDVVPLPTECQRKKGDECKVPNTNRTDVIIKPELCEYAQDSNQYYKSNCVLKVKCAPGKMPADTINLQNSGIYTMKCHTNGNGWVDNHGNTVDEPMKCVDGCVPPTTHSHSSEKTVKSLIPSESGIITCVVSNSSTSTSISNHPYHCPKNETDNEDYYKSNCEDACRAPEQPLDPTIVVKTAPAPADYDGGYHKVGVKIVLVCAPGHRYPPGTPYAKEGAQMIQCDSKSLRWLDITPGAPSGEMATPVKCEKSPGCKDPKKSGSKTMITTKCSLVNGYYSAGCELKVSCPSGTYPDDKDALYGDDQTLVCDNSAGGEPVWKDKNTGKVVDGATTCANDCSKLEIDEVFNRNFKNSSSNEIRSEPVKDSDGHLVQCMSVITINAVEKFIDSIKSGSAAYFCKDNFKDNDKNGDVEKRIGAAYECTDTCGVPEIKSKTGVKRPAKIPSFNYGGKELVSKEHTVSFQCAEGYRYKSNSPYATPGKQEFVCKDGEWVDSVNNKKSEIVNVIDPETCERVPACPIPNSENTIHRLQPGCTTSDGKPIYGCKVQVECVPGTYPVELEYRSSPYQNITCDLDAGVGTWRDINYNKLTKPMTCMKGCLQAKANTNSSSSTNVVNIVFGAITVTCSETEVSKTTDHTYESSLPFYCKSENGTSDNTTEPMSCNNMCPPLQINDDLIISKKKHPTNDMMYSYLVTQLPYLVEKSYSYPDQVLYVRCKNGNYLNSNKNEVRAFQCNGPAGTYESEGTKGILSHIDTCVPPPAVCDLTLNSTSTPYLPPNYKMSCEAEGNKVMAGCQISLGCTPGDFHWHPYVTMMNLTTVNYTCQPDGKWRAVVDDRKPAYYSDKLPDVCQPGCPYDESWHKPNTTTTEPIEWICNSEKSGYGYCQLRITCADPEKYFIWRSDIERWTGTRVFECDMYTRKWIQLDDKSRKIDGPFTDSCQPKPPSCQAPKDEQTEKQKTSVNCRTEGNAYKCDVVVECSEGFIIRSHKTHTDKTTYHYQCDNVQKNFYPINGTSVSLEYVKDECVEEPPACSEPVLSNTTTQSAVVSCKIVKGVGYQCTVIVECNNGMVVKKTDVSTKTLIYLCNKNTSRLEPVDSTYTPTELKDVCENPPMPCANPWTNSTKQSSTLSCKYEGSAGYQCQLAVECQDGRVIRNTTTAISNVYTFRCNKDTKEFTTDGPIGSTVTPEDVKDICEDPPIVCDTNVFNTSTSSKTNVTCKFLKGNGYICAVVVECNDGLVIKNTEVGKIIHVYRCNVDTQKFVPIKTAPRPEAVKDECVKPWPVQCPFLNLTNTTSQTSLTSCSFVGGENAYMYKCQVIVECGRGHVIRNSANSQEEIFYYGCTDKGLPVSTTNSSSEVILVEAKDACIEDDGCQPTYFKNRTTQFTFSHCTNDKAGQNGCLIKVKCRDGRVINGTTDQSEGEFIYNCTRGLMEPMTTKIPIDKIDDICVKPKCDLLDKIFNTTGQSGHVECSYSGGGVGYRCKLIVECETGYILKSIYSNSTSFEIDDVKCTVNNITSEDVKNLTQAVNDGFCTPEVCEWPIVTNRTYQTTVVQCPELSEGKGCIVNVQCEKGYVLMHKRQTNKGEFVYACDKKRLLQTIFNPFFIYMVDDICVPPTCIEPKPLNMTDTGKNMIEVNYACWKSDHTKGSTHNCSYELICRNGDQVNITTPIKFNYTVVCLEEGAEMVPLDPTITIKDLDDKCPKKDIPKCSEGLTTKNTTYQDVHISCDKDETRCELDVQCKKGYKVDTKELKVEGQNYTWHYNCMDKTVHKCGNCPGNKDQSLVDLTCVPACDLNFSNGTVKETTTVTCKIIEGDGYKCSLVVECGEGFAIRSTLGNRTFFEVNAECKNVQTGWQPIDQSTNITISDICVAITTPAPTTTIRPSCASDIPIKNTTEQIVTIVDDPKTSFVEIKVNCLEGYKVSKTFNETIKYWNYDCDKKQVTDSDKQSFFGIEIVDTTCIEVCDKTFTNLTEGGKVVIKCEGSPPSQQCHPIIECGRGYRVNQRIAEKIVKVFFECNFETMKFTPDVDWWNDTITNEICYGPKSTTPLPPAKCILPPRPPKKQGDKGGVTTAAPDVYEYFYKNVSCASGVCVELSCKEGYYTVNKTNIGVVFECNPETEEWEPVDKTTPIECIPIPPPCTLPPKPYNPSLPSSSGSGVYEYFYTNVTCTDPANLQCVKVKCKENFYDPKNEKNEEKELKCNPGDQWVPVDKSEPPHCVHVVECTDLFATIPQDEYTKNHNVDVVSYTGHTTCARDGSCKLELKCKPGYIGRGKFFANVTSQKAECKNGTWLAYQGNETIPTLLDNCTCALLSCVPHCLEDPIIVAKETYEYELDISYSIQEEETMHVRCVKGWEKIVTNLTTDFKPCNNKTVLEVQFNETISPCTSTCKALNMGDEMEFIKYLNLTITKFELPKAFVEEKYDPSKPGTIPQYWLENGYFRYIDSHFYAKGRGLRLECPAGFTGLNGQTVMNLICDGASGHWLDEKGVKIYNQHMPSCPVAPADNEVAGECIVPKIDDDRYTVEEYKLSNCKGGNATRENFFCQYRIKCKNGFADSRYTGSQIFTCGIDQFWNEMTIWKHGKEPLKRLHQITAADLDPCKS